jgi:hypothetical protein
MSLPKKFAAIAAPVAAIAFLLAVPASAQNAPAPMASGDYSAPAAEAPKAKTAATRHAWTKKHAADKKASAKKQLTKASHEVK